MTSGELAERIRISFTANQPDDAIDGVKTAVSDFLRSTDPAVMVERTSYFNHSFAPDLVLRWPRENNDRYVYLRTNSDPDWLNDDIGQLGERQPLVMTLAATRTNGPLEQLASSARQHNTMVAEPGTLEALSQARHEKPVAGLLGSALLQGGRGVVSEVAVDAAVTTTSDGFDAAQSVSREPTRLATALLVDLLDSKQSERLTRVLRAVWEGHGGAVSDFPAPGDVAAILTGTDLRYLLESVEMNDPGFWRKIGRNLNLGLLTRIPPTAMPITFQYLVNANVTTLMAKAVRVEQTEVRLGDPDDVFEWLLSGENLALRGNTFTAYIAATTVDSLPHVTYRDGLSVAELQRRAEVQGLKLGRIRVTSSKATVTYESAAEANLVGDEGFSSVSGALGPAARVAEATVVLADGKRLICDFTDSTARGYTNAIFPVSELVGIAIPLIHPLDEVTQQKLSDLANERSVGADGNQQMSLFDDS